jgi:hypothetical protein
MHIALSIGWKRKQFKKNMVHAYLVCFAVSTFSPFRINATEMYSFTSYEPIMTEILESNSCFPISKYKY